MAILQNFKRKSNPCVHCVGLKRDCKKIKEILKKRCFLW